MKSTIIDFKNQYYFIYQIIFITFIYIPFNLKNYLIILELIFCLVFVLIFLKIVLN
jgi:hypothetical protein